VDLRRLGAVRDRDRNAAVNIARIGRDTLGLK
jgi:transposase